MAEFQTETSDQDVIECSDDENYGFIQNPVTIENTEICPCTLCFCGNMNEYCPKPSEIYSLYESLESGNGALLKLDWTCPGKKELTPEISLDTQSNSNEITTKEELLDQLNYDFQEDIKETNLRLINGKKELRGSARKKTTIFKEVVSNMARHQKLDLKMLENENSHSE